MEYQSECVEDIDERGEDLSVAVGRQKSSDGSENRHDGNDDRLPSPTTSRNFFFFVDGKEVK